MRVHCLFAILIGNVALFSVQALADCVYSDSLVYMGVEGCNNGLCMGRKRCHGQVELFYCQGRDARCPLVSECERHKITESVLPVKVVVRWSDAKPSVGALIFDQLTNEILAETDADGVARFNFYSGGRIRVTQPNYSVRSENIVTVDSALTDKMDNEGNYTVMTWWPLPGPLNTGDLR